MIDRCKIFIDLDGTLCGETKWSGFLNNTLSLFDEKLLYIPPNHIHWSILTARPKLDKLLIYLVCKWHSLKPDRIITTSTWQHHFENIVQRSVFKLEVLTFYIDHLDYDKVIYVDNDIILSNTMRELYHNDKLVICDTKSLKPLLESLTGLKYE